MKALMVALLLTGSAMPAQLVAAPAASPAAVKSQQDSSSSQAAAQGQRLIQSSSDVADPMFGIHVRAIGLERIVHVLQWHPNTGAPGGYDQVWSSERIGPEGLDAVHANPVEFPINGQRWWSQDAKLDSHPVATDVLTAVAADADAHESWSSIKPDLSQLPANLAVTFQPDGMQLTTSQDIAHPQVGDVQVKWRVIANPSAPSGAQLVDGRWEMPASSIAAEASPASSSRAQPVTSTAADDARAWIQRMFGNGMMGWLVVVGVVLALIALVLRRRRKPRRRR